MPKTMTRGLPMPAFVDLSKAADYNYVPQQGKIFDQAVEWRKKHGVKAAAKDQVKIHVLGIDLQKDFCHPPDDKNGQGGSLYVGGRSGMGAIDDNKRIAEFLYREAPNINGITTTLDTHFPFQIFFSSFWNDADGKPVPPFTTITTDDIRKGKFVPNPAVAPFVSNGNYGWLQAYVRHYTEQLEKSGKYKLYIRPQHCILGSAGHALNGLIHEAKMFHAYLRHTPNNCKIKGGNFLFEHYSIFCPEVTTTHEVVNGVPRAIGSRDADFLQTLLDNDAVIIVGQAASHCVKNSIDDLLTEVMTKDPSGKLVSKVYVATDGMSAVTVPDGKGGFFVDYTKDAEESFKRYKDAGMHIVDLSMPIESYPGIKL